MKIKSNVLIFPLILFFAAFFQGCEKDDSTNEIISGDVVFTLGANSCGVIGNGTLNDAKEVYKIVGLRNIIQVAASSRTCMALASNGKVFAWGNNEFGQIGIGPLPKSCTFPREVKGLPEIKKIAVSNNISLALDKSGNVWMWGTIFAYNISNDTPIFSSSIPKKVNLSDMMDISCGDFHCAAVSSGGDVYTWGENGIGMLGDGTTVKRLEPQKISGISNVIKVSAGRYHSIALTNDKKVYSWGYNNNGQLGLGIYDLKVLTPSIIPGMQNVIDIAAGSEHNLCLLSDGSVCAWGDNTSGQIGNNSFSNTYYPVPVASIKDVKQIAACAATSIALTKDNKFWSWGYYQSYTLNGMLGCYTGTIKKIPTRLMPLDNSKIIATGGYNYLVVK